MTKPTLPSLLTGIEVVNSPVTSEALKHPRLDETRDQVDSKMNMLWARFDDAEGPEAEIKAARDLARMYLIKTAGRAALDGQDRPMWAERYTRASSELYGAPESDVARGLIIGSIMPIGGGTMSAEVSAAYNNYITALTDADVEIDQELNTREAVYLRYESVNPNVIAGVREGLDSLYGDALEEITRGLGEPGINATAISVGPEELKRRFENGIQKLAERDDRWKDCKVVIEQNARLRVVGNTIYIGSGMKPRTSIDEIKRSFAHEGLVHAQLNVRGVSGRNLDGEEGLAIIFEQAFGLDQPPQRIKDRYMDISIALGQQGDSGYVSRQKLMQIVRARNEFRGAQGLPIQTESAMIAHVNRIYRGTQGTPDSFGILTKDIVYFAGYAVQADYLEQRFAIQNPREVLTDILTRQPEPGAPMSHV